MQGGSGPTPLPGMSVPRDLSRGRRRIRAGMWVSVVLTLVTWLGGDLLWGDDAADDGNDLDRAFVARVLLSPADLDGVWSEEAADDFDGSTVGITASEAECLGVGILQPAVEQTSGFFTKDGTTVRAVVGVWSDEFTARAGAEAMARDDYPSCLLGQMLEQEEDNDGQDRAMVSLLGAGPAAADATVRRYALLYGWPDGFTETFETYLAFKGRTQVVLFTWTPAGVDQAFAVELVRKMLARAG